MIQIKNRNMIFGSQHCAQGNCIRLISLQHIKGELRILIYLESQISFAWELSHRILLQNYIKYVQTYIDLNTYVTKVHSNCSGVHMRLEEHRKAVEEHERNIGRCIDDGMEKNQRNLGYNVSQASIEMLSIYLLKLKLVQISVNFDHRIFKHSKSLKETLKFDFPEKTRILDIMRKIEEKRNVLCYGKRKTEKDVTEMLELYNKLKEILGETHEE